MEVKPTGRSARADVGERDARADSMGQVEREAGVTGFGGSAEHSSSADWREQGAY